MALGPSFDPEGVEQALRCLPEFELKGLFRRSSNYTFLAQLRGQLGVEDMTVLAVYKPAEGESPLWDFPAGSLYRREVAAYQLAKFLGWPRVPPTVVRETAPHGVGALQMFVEAEAREHYLVSQGQPEETWLQVALFDVITNNADRKSGHCLTDAERRVWVIDHGLTFHIDPKLRTVIWDFAGQRLPRPLREDLERAAISMDEGDLKEALGELLTRRELATLRRRMNAASQSRWEMPHPTSAWSVPWPPV
jgi:uncharacterized repeat protein (TIGR03843 family)